MNQDEQKPCCVNCHISGVPLYLGLDGKQHCADHIGLLLPDSPKQETNTAICDMCVEQLRRHAPSVLADASPDALLSHVEALKLCQDNLPPAVYEAFLSEIETIKRTVRQRTAWRLDGTLREFPKFEPKNLWFRYPVHVEDTIGVLKDLQSESEMHPYQRGNQKRGAKTKETYAAQKADKKAAFENAFNACNLDGTVTVQNMAEYLGVSRRTIENRIKEYDGFILKNGDIVRETSK